MLDMCLTQLTSPTFHAHFTAGPPDRPLWHRRRGSVSGWGWNPLSFFFLWHHFYFAECTKPLPFSTEQEHNKRSMVGHKLTLAGDNPAISKFPFQEVVDVYIGMH